MMRVSRVYAKSIITKAERKSILRVLIERKGCFFRLSVHWQNPLNVSANERKLRQTSTDPHYE